MKKFIYLLSILSLNFNLFSQDSNIENVEEAPSKLEQLIIDIESEIDIEKSIIAYNCKILQKSNPIDSHKFLLGEGTTLSL